MKVIPKRTFLLRQDELENGKKKDVILKEGVKAEVTDKEAVRFAGYFDFDESDKKKLKKIQSDRDVLRLV